MRRILWRITKLAALERGRLAVAWGSLITASVLFLAVPRLVGTAVDTAVGAGGREAATGDLVRLGLLVIGVIAVRSVFNYGNLYMAEAVSQRVAYRIRQPALRQAAAPQFRVPRSGAHR